MLRLFPVLEGLFVQKRVRIFPGDAAPARMSVCFEELLVGIATFGGSLSSTGKHAMFFSDAAHMNQGCSFAFAERALQAEKAYCMRGSRFRR